MYKTMITMFRYNLSNDENQRANDIFLRYLKKFYPNTEIKPSSGFWKEENCEMNIEPGFTVSNLTKQELENLKEVVANPVIIGLKGHSQQGFIEINNETDEVRTYRLDNENSVFVFCDGTSSYDWGVGLTEQINIPLTNKSILDNIAIGGTIYEETGDIFIICDKEQRESIEKLFNQSIKIETKNSKTIYKSADVLEI